eukprot:3700014-Alexandrium_andersonii.AAC.1
MAGVATLSGYRGHKQGRGLRWQQQLAANKAAAAATKQGRGGNAEWLQAGSGGNKNWRWTGLRWKLVRHADTQTRRHTDTQTH